MGGLLLLAAEDAAEDVADVDTALLLGGLLFLCAEDTAEDVADVNALALFPGHLSAYGLDDVTKVEAAEVPLLHATGGGGFEDAF